MGPDRFIHLSGNPRLGGITMMRVGIPDACVVSYAVGMMLRIRGSVRSLLDECLCLNSGCTIAIVDCVFHNHLSARTPSIRN